MSKQLPKAAVAAVVGGLLVGAVGVGASGAATGAPVAGARPAPYAVHAVTSLPQRSAAHRAAAWLAKQVNAKGYLTSGGSPDLSDTTLTVLALAAVGGQRPLESRMLRYLEGHVNAYVTVDGHDGPGQLATLILDAHVLGASPTNFGGTNLVRRLLATMRTTGADTGLFGVQAPTYDGAYRQGLALAALAAAGVTAKADVGPAVTWLQRQQCSNGGWEAYRSTTTPCTATDPDAYTGPDTNSTALAIEGLAAQHATLDRSPITFYLSLQTAHGGWGAFGGSADPDSTALVIQSLLALHDSVSAKRFQKGTSDPVDALLYFQLKNGAFYFPSPPSPNTPSALSTEQAIPALEMKAFPF